ncbi:MAG: prephenate dehydratase domain-containing protein, partial [Planctomycetota bacterium]
MAGLEKLRDQIDQTDEQILLALARRMNIVEEVVLLKESEGLPVFDAHREKSQLLRAGQRAAGCGLDPDLVKDVLKVMLRHSRKAQIRRLQERANPLSPRVKTVAYQGSEGAYSWIALHRRFTDDVEAIGFPEFRKALVAVRNGVADQALLPIENTLAGSIHEVYDLLAEEDLHVVGEEVLSIKHCLIGIEPVPVDRIRKVISHPVALQQCTKFLRSMDQAECCAFVDTAEAVARVRRDNDPCQVAIASREAAELYGLAVLHDQIADHEANYTRFWVISRTPVRVDPKVAARTSLLLVTDHREGALFHCLQGLAAHGINMTKLESRPLRDRPWQYAFYLDVEGNLSDEPVMKALNCVRERARVLRVLGCYPRARQMDISVSGRSSETNQKNDGNPPVPPMRVGAVSAKAQRAAGDSHAPLHARTRRSADTVVDVSGVRLGGDAPFVVMAGPCAVESRAQIMTSAAIVRAAGGRILRGGAYKPRTSPYSFQGLGAEGISLLVESWRAHHLPVVSEVLSPEQVGEMAACVDLLQVGARNMQNYPLLRELGRARRPVLLKRGMSATLDELLNAAEYILAGGNQQVILCERGIRTFDSAMRSTLDLGAVVVLK